jgi:hypothetical protein
MRVRAAYISSLGTGGIIVASALLMLALVSALVAFHAWPGGRVGTGAVSSVPLTPSSAAATTRADTTAAARAATAGAAAGRVRDTAHSRAATTGTAGLHKDAAPTGRVDGGHVFGMVKVPPTTGPAAPPVQFPPPSTGPQTPSTRTGEPQPEHRYDPGLTGMVLDALPGSSVPGDVDGTAGGVVTSLPPGVQQTVDQVPLPSAQLDAALGGTGVKPPGR